MNTCSALAISNFRLAFRLLLDSVPNTLQIITMTNLTKI